jgi:hypothetical protein
MLLDVVNGVSNVDHDLFVEQATLLGSLLVYSDYNGLFT